MAEQEANPEPLDAETVASMMRAMAVTPGGEDDFTKKDFAFWQTQPVLQFQGGESGDDSGEPGAIEPAIPVDQVRQEPYGLPPGFEWCTCDTEEAPCPGTSSPATGASELCPSHLRGFPPTT